MERASTGAEERFGWRTFRLPPLPAIIFGLIYGALAGAIIVWDIAVVIRLFRLGRERVSQELESRRSHALTS
jgi:hypothetical protein